MTDWIDEKAGELAGRCECAPYDPCQRCSLADALREAYARGHIQGGCDLAIALGYSTGHADTFEDLRANVEAEDAERRKLPEDAEVWVEEQVETFCPNVTDRYGTGVAQLDDREQDETAAEYARAAEESR